MSVCGQGDDGFAADTALDECCKRFRCFVECVNSPDDRPDDAVVDECGDAAKLVTACAHDQKFVAHPCLCGLFADLATQCGYRKTHDGIQADGAGEGWVRGACNADCQSTPPEHAKRLFEVVATQAVENHVVTGEQLLEILVAVVDDDIGAESPNEVRVRTARGRGDRRPEVFCELNGDRPDPAGTGVDENLLSRLNIGSLDECLPCSECDER